MCRSLNSLHELIGSPGEHLDLDPSGAPESNHSLLGFAPASLCVSAGDAVGRGRLHRLLQLSFAFFATLRETSCL